jgi:hypothetical protein
MDANSLFYQEHEIYWDVCLSLSDLRKLFSGHGNEVQEGCNCKNAEALKRIDTLEVVISHLLNMPNAEQLFELLPYNKTGKLAKNKVVTLYLPKIKSVCNTYEYASQTEVALQLRPLEVEPTKAYQYKRDKLEGVLVLEINGSASFATNKPENLIDDTGVLKAQPENYTRHKYLKQNELKVGTSYTDSKGSEYLYLGAIREKYSYTELSTMRVTRSNDGIMKYIYLRITSGVKKEILRYNSLYDYLSARFTKNYCDKNNILNWNKGCNYTESKKFVSINTVYANESDLLNRPINLFLQDEGWRHVAEITMVPEE